MTFKKKLFYFLLYVFNHIILYFPWHAFRIFFMKIFKVKLGKGNTIRLFVKFLNPGNVTIGSGCSINQKVMFDGRGEQLIIGDNVDIGYETSIWTLEHDPHSDTHSTKPGKVVIEDYAWIASRVTILPGTIIGRGAVVAACSVVTKDVPPMAIVAGIPARVIGQRRSLLKYSPASKVYFR